MLDTCKGIVEANVAPYAGAWIEIFFLLFLIKDSRVAPYAGAWIEILEVRKHGNLYYSRSLRGSVD